MVTLTEHRQHGNFVYTNDDLEVKGNFEADTNGTLVSISASYTNIGNVNMYYNANTDKYQYYINAIDTDNIIIIAETIQTVWNEIEEEVNQEEPIEEEPTDEPVGESIGNTGKK